MSPTTAQLVEFRDLPRAVCQHPQLKLFAIAKVTSGVLQLALKGYRQKVVLPDGMWVSDITVSSSKTIICINLDSYSMF